MGYALCGLGKLEDAIDIFNQVLELVPQDWQVRNKLGTILGKSERYEDAILAFDKVIEIDSHNYAAHCFRGYALHKFGRNEDAIVAFDKAIEINPNYDLAWKIYGTVLYKLGKNEEAILFFDKALDLHPNQPSIFYKKACCYAALNNIDLAIENLRTAIHFNPEELLERVKNEPCFDGIRHDMRFKAL